MREQCLTDTTRRELRPRVADDADPDHGDVDRVPLELRDAPDRPLRDPALPEERVDPRDDLRPMRERHRAGVELPEVLDAQVHDRASLTTQAAMGVAIARFSAGTPKSMQRAPRKSPLKRTLKPAA